MAKPYRSVTVIAPNIPNKMDDYMDNMANAITNKKYVLKKLVETNSKQSSAIATQSTTILALSNEVNQLKLSIEERQRRFRLGG